ncbi:hypothetical protein VST35_17350, partial [Pseudomonas aeruginosa]
MRAALLPTFGALSAALCLEARADAVALPPLALGNTSFMDGVSRPAIEREGVVEGKGVAVGVGLGGGGGVSKKEGR